MSGVFFLVLVAAALVLPRLALRYQLGPEGQYFDSAGVRIHYTEAGRGTPLILIHGFADTANIQWWQTGRVKALAKDYRVITPDVRGHGRSDKPHDPSQYGAQLAEDLVRLLDHLKIDKAHVVGFSMGGFITLKMAAMHPERLLSVAPCGTGWMEPTPANVTFSEDVASAVERGGPGPLLKRLGVLDRPLRWWERIVAKAALSWFNDSQALAALMRGFPGLSVTEEQLRSNKVPALTLIGSRDGFLPEAKALADHMANHELAVLEGADHMDADRTEPFLTKLRAFLAAHTPAS